MPMFMPMSMPMPMSMSMPLLHAHGHGHHVRAYPRIRAMYATRRLQTHEDGSDSKEREQRRLLAAYWEGIEQFKKTRDAWGQPCCIGNPSLYCHEVECNCHELDNGHAEGKGHEVE